MHHLEAHAEALYDAELSRRCDEMRRGHEMKLSDDVRGEVMRRSAARAFGREQVAGIALTESIERLEDFERRRLDVPLLYCDGSGEMKVGRLREVEPADFADRLRQRFAESAGGRGRREAIRLAAAERHRQLLDERERAGECYTTTRDVAERHSSTLHANDHWQELPAAHYTAKEAARIEAFAARHHHPEARAVYEELLRTAVAEGRVGHPEIERKQQQTGEHGVERWNGLARSAEQNETRGYKVGRAIDSDDPQASHGADGGAREVSRAPEHAPASIPRERVRQPPQRISRAASNDQGHGVSF